MQDQNTIPSAPNPADIGKGLFYTATIFVAVAIVSIIGLKLLTNSQANAWIEGEAKITEINKNIAALEADKDVKLAAILKNDANIKKSEDIRGLIQNFRSIASEYGVRFQWFNLAGGHITTSMTAQSENGWEAAEPILKMMEDYRKNKNKFLLKPILSLGWDPDRRSTWVDFEINREAQVATKQ